MVGVMDKTILLRRLLEEIVSLWNAQDITEKGFYVYFSTLSRSCCKSR